MHKCFVSLNLGAFEVKVLRKKKKQKKQNNLQGGTPALNFWKKGSNLTTKYNQRHSSLCMVSLLVIWLRKIKHSVLFHRTASAMGIH